MLWIVVEIVRNRVIGSATFDDEKKAIDRFCALVEEYGVEPYDEMINNKIFEEESGEYTVQILVQVDGFDDWSSQALS